MRNKKTSLSASFSRSLRLLECCILFIGIPALMYFSGPFRVLPFLWLFALGCGIVLFRDPNFDRANLWRSVSLSAGLKSVAIHFVAGTVILSLLVYLLAPQLLFGLIKQRPLLWLLIIIFYPLLSVYPQELIYRTYFFHRYQALFPQKWVFLVLNGLLFGYMHIIFHNWIAVSLTAIGGIIFALTYQRFRSTLLVSIEHALFGGLLFTIGLGQFFYSGAISTISQSLKF